MQYLCYRSTYLRRTSISHITTQVKYVFSREPSASDRSEQQRPIHIAQPDLTDDNPLRLFTEIADRYKQGDVIRTVRESSIVDNKGGSLELIEPLSSDELRLLGAQIAQIMGDRKR